MSALGLYVLALLAVAVLLTALLAMRQSKQITRLDMDTATLALGDLVAGNRKHAEIRLYEHRRAQMGLCTARRTDGAPCTLDLYHSGSHSYAGERHE